MRNYLTLSARRTCSLLLGAAIGLSLVMSGATTSYAQNTLNREALIGDSVSEVNSDRYADIEEAIKRFGNRDVLGARQFLEAAKRKEERLPPVEVMLAKMFYLTNNASAGQATLEQAAVASPGDPEPYLIMADQAFAAGQTIVADALYDRAVRLLDGYDANAKRKRQMAIRAYAGRAAIAQRRNNWTQAEADLRQWLETDPENAAAHQRLGEVLFMLDRDRDGYEEFVKARQLNDKVANPYVLAAMMYDRQDKDAEAQQAFERAYSENKNDEATVVYYAQWLLKSGDIQKAETVLAGARNAVPNSVNVWLLSGVAATMAKKPGPAEQYFAQALALQPSNRDAYNQMAVLLADQPESEKKARAVQFAGINAQLNENNADVNVTLAYTLFQSNQAGRAAAVLQKALSLGAMSADSKYLIAKVLHQRNDSEKAKQLLEDAFKNQEGIFVYRSEAQDLLSQL